MDSPRFELGISTALNQPEKNLKLNCESGVLTAGLRVRIKRCN